MEDDGKIYQNDTPLPHVGIDEKAFLKGQNYITLVYDLDHSTVEAISDGNDTEAGFQALSELSESQLQSIEALKAHPEHRWNIEEIRKVERQRSKNQKAAKRKSKRR